MARVIRRDIYVEYHLLEDSTLIMINFPSVSRECEMIFLQARYLVLSVEMHVSHIEGMFPITKTRPQYNTYSRFTRILRCLFGNLKLLKGVFILFGLM